MISQEDRAFVEQTKVAERIVLYVHTKDGTLLKMNLTRNKKLYHDIALAIQDFLVKNT